MAPPNAFASQTPVAQSPAPSELSILKSTSTFTGESPAPNSRLYSAIHQAVTATGELSPSPPLQSILNNTSPPPHPGWRRYRQDDEERLAEDLLSSELLYGQGHSSTLSVLVDLGRVLVEQGRYRSAEALLQRSLSARPSKNDLEGVQVLDALDLLGEILREQGRYQEAQKLHDRVIASRKSVLGPSNPSVFSSMGNLATVYHCLGHYVNAEALQVQALENQTWILGHSHEDTLKSKLAYASIMLDRGRWKDAEESAIEAKATATQSLGQNHPLTIKCKTTLTSVIRIRGRWAEAKELATEALTESIEVFGPEHPLTLDLIAVLDFTVLTCLYALPGCRNSRQLRTKTGSCRSSGRQER